MLSFFFRFFTSIPLAKYSVHPTPSEGPGPETLLRAETAPSKDGPELLGHREGIEVVVKPNTAGGSVSPSKSGPESVYYYSAVQFSWSIHPRETKSPGRRGWWAVPMVPVWVFVLPKGGMEVLNRKITDSVPQQG